LIEKIVGKGKTMKQLKNCLALTIILILAFCAGAEKTEDTVALKLTPKEELGKLIFFDSNLSTPPGQACADCHGPLPGWSGPDSEVNETTVVYPGALEGRFGNRRPPTAAYAGDSPKLYRDEEGTFVGGMFWDGRATGWEMGDPLAEQAMGPFLNPLEMNNPDKETVIRKIQESGYAEMFEQVWGENSLTLDDVDGTYVRIAVALAAFERSFEVNPFSSKFDDFWRKATATGLDVAEIDDENIAEFAAFGLNEIELKGLMLFNTTGLCAECHVLTSVDGTPPLFTDFTYDNLGVPRNPDNPFYTQEEQFNPKSTDWVDNGLGEFLESTEEFKDYAAENYGKQKVPTLRNVDLRPAETFVKAFMHNGFFKTLKEVVHFYNIRDTAEADWPEPEVAANVNVDELGDLALSEEDEDAIVKFMQTLSDRKK